MSSYSELVKNFERVRAYMREFYLYGFKSREEYDKKSARSYDDERRRMESWLKDYMRFYRTPEGKSVFLSIDSRAVCHNPFYRALEGKSFTDGDITLHFILFDILHDPHTAHTLGEILALMGKDYLSSFEEPMVFDESTVRKKLKEYCAEGLVLQEKRGKTVLYRRAPSLPSPPSFDAISFFSEASLLGATGYFLLQKAGDLPENGAKRGKEEDEGLFTFKHHYLASALDSDVELALLEAMQGGYAVTLTNHSRRQKDAATLRVIPLRIFVSAQNGRHHLMAYHPKFNCIKSFRIDYLSKVKLEEPTPRFDELKALLDRMQKHLWGVSLSRTVNGIDKTERAEFTVWIGDGEEYLISRLHREKRVGRVEQIDEHTYRFTVELYDTGELIPFLRTFIGRILSVNCSNREVEKRFLDDLKQTYALYGIGKEDV